MENARDLEKRFAARVKAKDMLGCIDEPDAISASRDLGGISPYACASCPRWDRSEKHHLNCLRPTRHSLPLRSGSGNLERQRLRGEVEVVDAPQVIESPDITTAGDDLRQPQAFAEIGDKDQALVWLANAYSRRSSDLTLLKVDPAYDLLRGRPAVQRLAAACWIGISKRLSFRNRSNPSRLRISLLSPYFVTFYL